MKAAVFFEEVAVGLGVARQALLVVPENVVREKKLRVAAAAGTEGHEKHLRLRGEPAREIVRHDLQLLRQLLFDGRDLPFHLAHPFLARLILALAAIGLNLAPVAVGNLSGSIWTAVVGLLTTLAVGLVAVHADPAFGKNGFIYVVYVNRGNPAKPEAPTTVRVSRFKAAGNSALGDLADLIAANIREVDAWFLCTRDQFIIVMDETDGQAAHTVAERLASEAESTRFILGPADLARDYFSASAGASFRSRTR